MIPMHSVECAVTTLSGPFCEFKCGNQLPIINGYRLPPDKTSPDQDTAVRREFVCDTRWVQEKPLSKSPKRVLVSRREEREKSEDLEDDCEKLAKDNGSTTPKEKDDIAGDLEETLKTLKISPTKPTPNPRPCETDEFEDHKYPLIEAWCADDGQYEERSRYDPSRKSRTSKKYWTEPELTTKKMITPR